MNTIDKETKKVMKQVDKKIEMFKDLCDSEQYTKEQFLSIIQLFISLYYGIETK